MQRTQHISYAAIGCALIAFSFLRSPVHAQVVVENTGFFTADSLLGCDAMSVQFQLPGNTYSSVSWNFGNGVTSVAENPTTSYNNAGDYTVSVLINGDTLYIERDMIRLRKTPNASFTYNDTTLMGSLTWQFVLTDYQQILPGYTVEWNFGDGSTRLIEEHYAVDHAFLAEGTYVIESQVNSLVCEAQHRDTLTVGNVFDVPNVFSPNNDGVNDLFMVHSNGVDDITLEIFNRWGSPVYRRTSKTVFWDGYDSSGKACQPGVYFYVVYSSNGLDKQEGFVHLYR